MRDKTKNRFISSSGYTNIQLTALVTLRVLIGWHLLYEGIAKAINPYWSSGRLLSESQWIFSRLFSAIADSQAALQVVDFLNIWGLVLIGIALISGCFSRLASILGAILLLLYYLAAPPLVDLKYSMPNEGSYLVVNKTLIEASALFVLWLFPTGRIIGLDRLIFGQRGTCRQVPSEPQI